jgi:hypothetical protein
MLATDASGLWGMGGVWDDDVFSVPWSEVEDAVVSAFLPPAAAREILLSPDLLPLAEDSINYEELFAIVYAIMLRWCGPRAPDCVV